MKRKGFICLVLIAALACSLFSGCGSNSNSKRTKSGEVLLNAAEETNDRIYTSEALSLEAAPTLINQLLPYDSGFIISGDVEMKPVLRSYSIQGNLKYDFDLSWLAGNQSVSKIQVTDNGNIYLLCSLDEADSLLYTIYNFNPNGELIPLENIELGKEIYVWDMLYLNDELYLSCENVKSKSTFIEVYSDTGNKERSFEIGGAFSLATDGAEIYVGIYDVNGLDIKLLNTQNGSLLDVETFSSGQILSAYDGKIFLKDKADVYCFDTKSGNVYRPFEWIGNGANPSSRLCPLPDGNFIIWSSENVRLLKEAPIGTEPIREITLALNGLPMEFSDVVIHFNDENKSFHVTIKDYSSYPDPMQTLATEINSGSVPDIVDIFSFSNQLASDKVFEDLVPYFENDKDISLSDLLETPLKTTMTDDGKLLGIVPSFSIWSFACRGDDFNDITGMNVRSKLEALGNPQEAFADSLSRSDFLALAFCCGNTDTYTVDDVSAILEFSEQLPEQATGFGEKNISEGTQKILALNCSSSIGWWSDRQAFGGNAGDMKIIGMPFYDGLGIIAPSCNLAIPSASSNKDGAWEFIKYMLLNEVGAYAESVYCPILKEEYEFRCSKDEEGIKAGKMRINGENVEDTSHIEEFNELLNGVSGMYNGNMYLYGIVSECAGHYFGGQSTSQEAAQDIISRFDLYYNEHK